MPHPTLALTFIASFPTYLLAVVFILSPTVVANADEKLKDIACRSVHLGYPSETCLAFYNEVEVHTSAPGTYFMACGWDKGYYGIQELANGKKLLIFSVWDSPDNDPNALNDKDRVKLLHKDDAVRIGRFGGEGSGGQSFYDFNWENNQKYRFAVSCEPQGNRTAYSGYFFDPLKNRWIHLVTFSTITGGKKLSGLYSFVEDFKRDRKSALQERKAFFGNAHTLDEKGQWLTIRKARFTADQNPVLNISAGIDKGIFYLATGGKTVIEKYQLRDIMELEKDVTFKVPDDLTPLVKR